jgi:hypothetical protein
MLDAPFTFSKLFGAVKQAATGRSPWLDGLPYEFYKALLPLVSLPLLQALNGMLETDELVPPLQSSVICLNPKVASIPTAVQIRPFTLLCIDYKLLTKMLTARMPTVLPKVLRSS